MRKNNTAIIFGSLFFSCSVMAANGTLSPTVVPMVNGGQASIAISNTSPNLFTVPGDRIIAVNSLDGALTNNEQTASGGVVVATVNKKPFTFILETERGLNLSIQAVPREGAGRTIQLVSDLRGTGEEAGAWETSTPYESLLVTISQAVRGGKLPAGWYQVPVTKETLQAPAGLSSVADAVWTGNHLKMVRFAVENKTLSVSSERAIVRTRNISCLKNGKTIDMPITWLQSFLVWSPGQRDIIKTVALVLMVLDHINLIFQLKQEWMFLAGRGAFPLFALVWGLNLSRHAHIRQPAINRLWGWGIIAQFAYYLAGFPWYEGNILFAFAVAAQVLTWCETRSGWRTAAAILLMALWGPLSGTSYGIAGLLMLAVSHRLYRAEDRAERLALVACLLAVIPALNLATSDAAAVAGLVMTVLTVGLVSCAGKSLPRFWPGDFFPVFYACHLAVLGVLAL